MDKNTRRYFTTLLDTNPKEFLQELSSCMKNNNNERVNILLNIMEDRKHNLHNIKLYREGEDKTETLLHVAVKYEDDIDTIRRIICICPELLTMARESSENYKGQTALHIAITRGEYHVINLLLSSAETEVEVGRKQLSNRTKITMINTLATGKIFANTVMMGELPLSVASLKFDTEAVDLLIKYGADIHAQNSFGDTVLHSLVRYSAVYPNKINDVIMMFEHLNSVFKEEKTETPQFRGTNSDIRLEEDSYVWLLENYDHLTPLQLAAKHGVVELFQFIINLENVYSFISTHDGLFDVKLYDITEIDTVAHQHLSSINTRNEGFGNKRVSRNIDGVSRTSIKTNTDCSALKCNSFEYPEAESILEMMFDYDYRSSSAFRIIETTPVKNIIQEKWRKLRMIYFIWGFVHLLLTICLTAELVIRSNMYATKTMGANNTLKTDIFDVSSLSKAFAAGISWISFILGGAIYCILVILLLIAKFRRPNATRYILHNLGYICFLFVFSGCLFVDFFMTQVRSSHDNIALIMAIIAGWWFAVFFLRAIQLFSFFTEMIRRVIIGDLLRFAVIISFMLFAFTAGMYAVFVGNLNTEQKHSIPSYIATIEDNFDSYGGTMLTMFKLMLGLGDIEVLNQARMPGLAIALYIVFAILTYVLLINSLIAMMSQTCAIVLEDKYPQWRLQQVSVILFLEDLFCLPCMRHTFGSPGSRKEIRGFDPVTKQAKTYDRYFLTIHSLQTTYASEEDREAMKKTVVEPERLRSEAWEETLTGSDFSSIINTFSNGRMRSMPSSRRRPTLKTRLTDVESPDGIKLYNDGSDKRLRRKKSSRLAKQLSRVDEESVRRETNVKQAAQPDLIKVEKSPGTPLNQKSPGTKRRRYHSENMHEKENRSPTSLISYSSENLYSNIPLTPVDSRLRVHNHRDKCPEHQERLVPNGQSHVDIEPYPHSKS